MDEEGVEIKSFVEINGAEVVRCSGMEMKCALPFDLLLFVRQNFVMQHDRFFFRIDPEYFTALIFLGDLSKENVRFRCKMSSRLVSQ